MFRDVGFTELLFTSENGMGVRNDHIPGGLLPLFTFIFLFVTCVTVTVASGFFYSHCHVTWSVVKVSTDQHIGVL